MKKKELFQFYNTYRLYIFPALVIVSSLFLIIFAIYPQTMKLINNQKTAGEIMTKVQFLDSKVSALENYNEEELSSKLAIALSVYPSEKDFQNVLGLLQQLVSGSGFTITSISLGSSGVKSGNSDSFIVKLDVKGNKQLVQSLLNNLESAPRLIKISTIDVSLNQLTDTSDVSLSLDLLFASIPQGAGGADSPVPELSQKDEEVLASLRKIDETTPKELVQSPRGKSNPFE